MGQSLQDRLISGRHLEIMQLFGPNPPQFLVVQRFRRLRDGHFEKVKLEAWIDGDHFRFCFQNAVYSKFLLDLSNHGLLRKFSGLHTPTWKLPVSGE